MTKIEHRLRQSSRQMAPEETRSVIIEASVPEIRVGVRDTPRGPFVSTGDLQFPAIDEDDSRLESSLMQLRRLLQEVGAEEPRVLRYAHALVAELTPKQLATIADSDLVAGIRENAEFGNVKTIAS